MSKKKTHGGKRKGAGRKPGDDNKIPVTLYVRESIIEELGIDEVKEKCYDVINNLK